MKMMQKTSRILVLSGLLAGLLVGNMGVANAAMDVGWQWRHVLLDGDDDGDILGNDWAYSYKREKRAEAYGDSAGSLLLEGLPRGFEPGLTNSSARVTTSAVGDTLNYSSKLSAEYGDGLYPRGHALAEWKVHFALSANQSYKLSFDSYMSGYDDGSTYNLGYDFSLVKVDYVNGQRVDTIIFDKPFVERWDGPNITKFDKLLDLSAGQYAIRAAGNAWIAAQGPGGGADSWQQFSMSPVPEPTTWGMLALGLGVVGFAAKRRKAGAASAA
jgi:hypothetical protein